MSDHPLDRVFECVARRTQAFREGQIDPQSRTHRMLKAGRGKIAQKVGEEAVEVVIEAVGGKKRPLIEESADLLYFLTLMWAERGIDPEKIWAELDARLGLPEPEERARRKP